MHWHLCWQHLRMLLMCSALCVVLGFNVGRVSAEEEVLPVALLHEAVQNSLESLQWHSVCEDDGVTLLLNNNEECLETADGVLWHIPAMNEQAFYALGHGGVLVAVPWVWSLVSRWLLLGRVHLTLAGVGVVTAWLYQQPWSWAPQWLLAQEVFSQWLLHNYAIHRQDHQPLPQDPLPQVPSTIFPDRDDFLNAHDEMRLHQEPVLDGGKVVIYTDGLCQKDMGKGDGTGGWAALVQYRDDSEYGGYREDRFAGSYRCTTNFRMRLQAVVNVLSELDPSEDDVVIVTALNRMGDPIGRSDISKYHLESDNADLWHRIYELKKKFPHLRTRWMLYHLAEGSKRVRNAAKKTQRQQFDLRVDTGYERLLRRKRSSQRGWR